MTDYSQIRRPDGSCVVCGRPVSEEHVAGHLATAEAIRVIRHGYDDAVVPTLAVPAGEGLEPSPTLANIAKQRVRAVRGISFRKD